MEVQNNKTENPIRIYQEKYKTMNPEDMARKCNAPFDGKNFILKFMNRKVKLSFPEMETYYEDGTKTGDYQRILLARYVMEAVDAPGTGKYLSYPEVPWGETYFDAFRRRCINRLAGTYGYNTDGFVKGCEDIGATKIKEADFSYLVEFLPNLYVKLLLWAPDEEFGPQAQILFSDNFPLAFTAEDMAVVGDAILNALKGRW